MSTPRATGFAAGVSSPARAVDFYRAVWRWHFYAGLFALPFMLVLAVTGGIYLFHYELDDLIYRDLRTVPASTAPAVPPSVLAEAATREVPGTVFRYVSPASETASAQIGVRTPEGVREIVYLDPRSGAVLGSMPDRGSVVWLIREIHSLTVFGKLANALIEIAAGWSILLVLTGVYLWWPRGQPGGVVSVRATPSKRVFWRDLHAVVGVFSAGFILFLAVTGMPWSLVWGAKVNEWANGNNFGYPDGVRVNVPMSDARLAELGSTTWSLEQARLPASTPPAATHQADGHGQHSAGHAGHGSGHAQAGHGSGHGQAGNAHGAHGNGHSQHGSGHAAPTPVASDSDDEHAGHGGGASSSRPVPPVVQGAVPIGLDRAVAAVNALGMTPGYVLALPSSPTGVYTASIYPNDLSRQRVLHLDQYRGVPLLDMSYADYGPLGKTLEWGVNVHMGQEFGLANQLLMLAACVAIVLLCVSAAVMWWKRRPSGRLGVPPLPANPRALRVVVVMLAIGGVVFPLVGLSMLIMFIVDRVWMRSDRSASAS